MNKNFQWPFVTRTTLQQTVAEKDARITELKLELAETRKELKRLNNQFTWRATGVALDPDELPEAYRPRAGQPPTTEDIDPMSKDVPTGMESIRKKTGTANVRANLKAYEADRQKLYDLSGLATALHDQKPISEAAKLRIVRAATEQAEAGSSHHPGH